MFDKKARAKVGSLPMLILSDLSTARKVFSLRSYLNLVFLVNSLLLSEAEGVSRQMLYALIEARRRYHDVVVSSLRMPVVCKCSFCSCSTCI